MNTFMLFSKVLNIICFIRHNLFSIDANLSLVESRRQLDTLNKLLN